jgi:hypothetical protein
MGHLVGKKGHANLPRGFHKNEERNNHRSVIRVDDTFSAGTKMKTLEDGRSNLGEL